MSLAADNSSMSSHRLITRRIVLDSETTLASFIDCNLISTASLYRVFSCTLNAVPETQGLLDKSRLPFGIHLHPFKELPEEVIGLVCKP